MKRYVLTDDRFTGSITLGYSDEGNLVLYDNNTDIPEHAVAWMVEPVTPERFPRHESQIALFAQKAKCKIEELPEDLSFDVFWNKYNKKINKKRCEPMWERLSDAKKLKVLNSIDAYKSYLQRTGFRAQADPENYLKKDFYDNDWSRLNK